MKSPGGDAFEKPLEGGSSGTRRARMISPTELGRNIQFLYKSNGGGSILNIDFYSYYDFFSPVGFSISSPAASIVAKSIFQLINAGLEILHPRIGIGHGWSERLQSAGISWRCN